MKKELFQSYIERYGTDERTLLREHPSLENLYAFANLREGVIEWYPFEARNRVLLIGAGEGALVELFLRKGVMPDVYEENPEEAEKLRIRYPGVSLVENPSGPYEYVVSVGTFHTLRESRLQSLCGELADGGVLIVACDNRYGLRYLTGTAPTGCIYSRDELTARLDRICPGMDLWYYPMNDYLLPVTVYSDSFLPEPGDLSHRAAAYNDNEFATIDVGRKFDEICRDGRFPEFANSFVVVRTKGAQSPKEIPSPRVIYVKYNRTRKDIYKLRTVIYENADGSRYVEKTALCEAGKEHIASFPEKYEILSEEGRDLSYAAPHLSEDGMTVRFEYINGQTLARRIAENAARGGDVVSELREALARLVENGPVHNIDSIFSNYLFGGRVLGSRSKLTGIDYEWVNREEADRKYVTFRALDEFYHTYPELFGEMRVDDLFRRFGLTAEQVQEYRQKEHDFQDEIQGDTTAIYLDNYRVQVKTADEMQQTRREAEKSQEEIEGLQVRLRDKDAEIKKLTEVKRLTDNHVNNLEVLIGNLRHEIGEMGNTLTYLNRHEALWSKVRRKAGEKFRAAYPEGSTKRKRLKYTKMKLTHPVQYLRMQNSLEGRNRMEGDYRIGSIYLQYGRLRFNRTVEPLVSIIIPCYNQVEYTYRCLASIEEHTKGINYEIILADDRSTDATAEMEKFVSGVQIIRPEKNLGFLRNCNHAASHAKGRYLMFLNNDTTVCEGWLSSLVELLEKDPTIGMTGSKLVFPDGRLQEAGGILWSDGSGWNYGRGDDPADYPYNYVRDVDYISGAAILIRKELWKQIGGFDERFAPAYCEDSDLAFAVRKAGYRVVYQPLSVVVHYEGVSNGTDVNGTGLKHYQIENSEKLREKWAEEFAQQYENNGNPDPFRARERSRGKKIILVVDHYVPTYDRDAGSKTTFQYLKLFLAMGFEVKFLGANFLHEEPYTTTLQQMGIEVIYGERMRSDIWDWIDKHAGELHLVYLNRPHIASQYVDYIKDHTALKVLYYGHDLHFLREEREFMLTGDVKVRDSSRYWKSVEFGLMKKTDMNYYPSQVEVDAIHEVDPAIRAKAITAYVYESFRDKEAYDLQSREGLLFVGGFKHPPNKDGLLWFVENIWPVVYANTAATFYVVGSGADEEVLALHDPEGRGICIKGFVSDEELTELYDRCRLVVVPLRYGAGVKGKTIEALYHGCPVVTTSVGAEGIPDAEKVMKIMDDAGDWTELLTVLYEDQRTLAKMSGTALDYVRQHHSMDAAWNLIKGDFT